MSLKNLRTFIKNLCLLALAAAAFPLGFVNAAVSNTSLTLGWDSDPAGIVQDYRVYVGTQSGQYAQTYYPGSGTSMPIDQLQIGLTYYFSVVAIGSTGLASPLSAELSVTIARPPLPTESTLTSNATGSLSLKWTFPVSHLGSSPQFIVQASSDLKNWSPVATVAATASLGRTGQMEQFSWPIPIPISGGRKFYRLTARNWMGESAAL